MDLDHYLQLAIDAAKSAGALLKAEFDGERTIEYKGVIDPVTEVDKASEKLLVDFFNENTPEIDILAEEGADKRTGRKLCWVIDPLDATINYAHKLPIYCVSIGLEKEGMPVVGVVYDPTLDELFCATSDSKSTCNGRPIKVSETGDFNRALFATGFPYDKRTNPENNLDHFSEMIVSCQGVRRVGSAALDLCWTAAGRYDGYWELSLAPWDISAGRLIAQQAGGKVTDFQGNPIDSFARYILATNGLVHGPAMEILGRNLVPR